MTLYSLATESKRGLTHGKCAMDAVYCALTSELVVSSIRGAERAIAENLGRPDVDGLLNVYLAARE